MPKNKKSSLQKKFNLKTPKKRKKLTIIELEIINTVRIISEELTRRGNFYLKTEKRRYRKKAKAQT
ncbi:hypothetical protein DRH27_03395 [Candidatus Falkowbacteria bacterium]|nr:MAG: hypothetical protein DRH27_03395 [Candidatus Falkowbacteria bacterium]